MGDRSLTSIILERIRALREKSGLTPEDMDERLVLGPGWVAAFESGRTRPSLDVIAAMLHVLGKSFGAVIEAWETEEPTTVIDRTIRAEASGADLILHFPYASFDATYLLKQATLEEFQSVLKALRNGLVGSDSDNGSPRLSDAVVTCFLAAVKTWPHANPSDLWWFLLKNAYCDPFNHEARFARKDYGESWKRTGGWALEKVFVAFYRDFLKSHGINISTGTKAEKQTHIARLGLQERLEADKVDILLTADDPHGEIFFGVVHVKASFAERRTDDVPMSRALIREGYASPLLTLDSKSMPGKAPVNHGELGGVLNGQVDGRSAKRKDIEDEGEFSACFSYNANTKPTPAEQSARARIYVLDFRTPDDAFARFIVAEWERVRARLQKTTEHS